MKLLDFPIQILALCNRRILQAGRGVAVVALGLMVVIMLIQVFWRYVLNNALPWPDEAARFCMLWMVALMAPLALRHGGFVAIDMFRRMLPLPVGAGLQLVLWLVVAIILVIAVQIGWDHVNSGWLFKSSSLKLPAGLVSERPMRMPLAYSYLSLFVSVVLMIAVSAELILRHVRQLAMGAPDPVLDAETGRRSE